MIKRNEALFYRTKKKIIRQGIWIYVICEKSIRKICEKLMDPTTKAGSDTSKTDSKKVNHKTAEATDELIGNKIADKTVKPLPVPDAN